MEGSGQTNPIGSERPRFDRYRPGVRLSPFVSNYWALQVRHEVGVCRRQRITPDGCIDIVFARRHPTEDFQAFVVGTMTRPILEDLAGYVEYLGIRFAPGGFGHFFRTPPAELTDRIVPWESLSAMPALTTRLADARNVPARLLVLEDALQRQLPGRGRDPQDPILAKVLETISACRGAVTIARLARTAGWSARHLRRVVRAKENACSARSLRTSGSPM